ncbi:MAG: glycosyltransferase family 4 protein [Nitrospirae bacterium]|nr:glycosyltransferase family 4 protein [Nitrospirota bacterium]
MAKNLKIWVVYQFASTPDMPGSERSYQFAKAFARMGHEVTFLTSSFNHWGKIEKITNGEPFILSSEDNLRIVYLKTRPLYYQNNHRRFLNMLYFACALRTVSDKVATSPDIIIASYPSPFAALAAYRLSKKYEAAFVLEIRDLWPQVWIERKAFHRYHPFVVLLFALEKYLYSRTPVFITALPYVSDYLSERGITPQKIEWVPNGINLAEFIEASKGDTAYDGVDEILNSMNAERQKGKMIAVYAGGIGVGNRVDYIIEAARILRDEGENNISFCIVGEGHSKKDIIRSVSDNKLGSVKIWPAIPRRAIPNVLSHADVGLLCLRDNPIYRYGVNLNKVYDYMAAGLPVVFSAKVRNNLVDISGGGITVQPENPAEIAKALKKLLSMKAEARVDMGKRGFTHIAENYDVNDKLSKRYIDAISRNFTDS